MLALMCKAAGSRFAVDARAVVEVVPHVRLQPIAGAPAWLAGACVYRGQILPVMDLAQLATGTACPNQWSSRIILVHFVDANASLMFGLIVEQVTVAHLPAEQRGASPGLGISLWGAMMLDEEGLFQKLELARLLTPERRAALMPLAENQDG